MAAVADPRVKKLRIQTGVIKRIAKEKIMYEKEAQEIESQVEKMENDKRDPYEIKKRKECLEESLQMGPDCKKRLQQAVEVMKELIETSKDLCEVPEYIAANLALDGVISN